MGFPVAHGRRVVIIIVIQSTDMSDTVIKTLQRHFTKSGDTCAKEVGNAVQKSSDNLRSYFRESL